MKRAEIEKLLKTRKEKSIGIVIKEGKIGMYCILRGGFLCDCWGHRIDRNLDIWGEVKYKDFGKGYLEPYQVKFE